MRIVFMGTPDFARKSLQTLYDEGHDIAAVFSGEDKPRGRGMKLCPCPVKELALSCGTKVYHGPDLNAETLRGLNPDVIAVVAYGRILKREVLEFPPLGCVNIHASLLPKYRGAAPIQHAILCGETRTGVTSQHMASEVDSGDVIFVKETDILPDETSADLFERLGNLGAELLAETIEAIGQGKAPRIPQNHAEATFAPMLRKEMSPIDWNAGAHEIKCKVRAFVPWPVATFDFGGITLKAFSVEATDKKTGLSPGTVLEGSGGIEVACGDGTVIVTRLQAPGGKAMSAEEYLRGRRQYS